MASNDSVTATSINTSVCQVNGVVDVKPQDVIDVAPTLATDEPKLDDSQTSDALDSQTEVEPETPSTLAIIQKKKVAIQVDQLEPLLETIVAKTDKWNLEKLLRLYSKLSKLVDRYLKLWDRRSLVEVIIDVTSHQWLQ